MAERWAACWHFPAVLKGAAQARDGVRRSRRRPRARTRFGSGADMYQSIGVRPLINARGTFTIISGSTMLPEVRAAMDAAARSTCTSTS